MEKYNFAEYLNLEFDEINQEDVDVGTSLDWIISALRWAYKLGREDEKEVSNTIINEIM